MTFFEMIKGLIIAAIICFVVVGFLGLRGLGSYDGEHTGIITAIEHRSNIVWASDIVYFKTSEMSTQEDVYCVQPQLIEKAKEFSRSKEIVTLHFHNDFFMWAWQCNGGDTIIDRIEAEIE